MAHFAWPPEKPLPEVGMRMWVEYALAGPIENFFEGAPELAIANAGFIEDESALYGNEERPLEPLIPQLLVQQPIGT
ncbi:MAG TPA: hypothetical protein VHC68_01885 [Candidatus Paceibacterota bacterium]|nr:hypothetical protein [Candidatus Paceibacterota bacterium]